MRVTSLLLTLALPLLAACSGSDEPTGGVIIDPVETTNFVRGADISWYTEMAADGKAFYDAGGAPRTCPALMKALGVNAVRLRVWVHPQNKGCNFSDQADVVTKAAEAKAQGLPLMIDFHLSDWWADPGRQDIPADWANLTHDQLVARVSAHVTTVLSAVKATGAEVSWVQIGNETRNGMMYPDGQLWNDQGDLAGGWQRFAQLYNAGYEAAHAVYAEAIVMPHLNHAYEDNAWWFDRFKAAGGKMDMIALSHYPQSDDASRDALAMNRLAEARVKALAAAYGVPVMVAEFGVRPANAQSPTVSKDFVDRMKALGTDVCAGVIYWEPEVYGSWRPASYSSYGWGAYDMGAFDASGRPTSILDPWRE